MSVAHVVGSVPALLLAAVATAAAGVPDLRQGRRAGPLTVFPDDQRPGLFYYPPGELALVNDGSGKPDFLLLLMQYTDPEHAASLPIFRNFLSFRIAMAGPSTAELRAALAELAPLGHIELRPLPIARLEAAVIYTPLGAPRKPADAVGNRDTAETATAARPLPPGHFDAADPSSTVGDTYWTERVYTIRLDDATAQLFDHAFRHGQLVLSFGYAFYGSGITPDQALAQLSGPPEVVAALRRQLGPDSAVVRDHLVRASAFEITVDPQRWPDLLQFVDMNERMPSGYPALEVYCYDFRDEIRDDLYAKRVDVRAAGVSGAVVARTILFSRAQHDLYAHAIRFSAPVRLDRPYRYRVTEILNDGRAVVQPWRERSSWVEMLDITTVMNAHSTRAH